MIRFLHTADLQLGMPFHWAGERAQTLNNYREKAVSTLANLAREKEVDFVVIAGDFFDDNTVEDRVVVRACERLAEFDVPVLILPGNHDAGGPDSVYRRDKFERTRPEHVVVLDEATPHVLADGKSVVLPAPLKFRHSTADPTTHLTSEFGRDEAPDAIRIGLAHGGVIDFDSGDGRNVIAEDRAERAELDYLALGDWHGCKQINPRTWYSGAPEPTSFKDNNQGYCLLVEIDGPGELPQVETLETAQTDWISHEVTFSDGADLDVLQQWFNELSRPLNTLVELKYRGTLSIADMTRFRNELLGDAEDRLLFLRRRDEGLIHRATDEELEEMASEGFVGVAVDRLRAMMEGEGEQAEVAGEALQIMHQLMNSGGE